MLNTTKRMLIAVVLLLCVTKASATQQIAIGGYQDKAMGHWSYRDHMHRPLVFNSTRKAQRFFEVSYMQSMYRFLYQRASFNLGTSLSHAKKSDVVVLDFTGDQAKFNMTIISLVPELKLNLWRPGAAINPYLAWSIGGISYLFGQRDSGFRETNHWQFKDYLGAGIDYSHWSINGRLVHYSGAKLLHKKKGFNIPWVLGIGYRFGSLA